MIEIGKDSGSINYIEYNKSAKETLLFIHGNSSSHKSFIKQANSSLLKKFRLIFLDLPGHGNSALLDKYTLPLMADEVVRFIKKIDLRNYIIVGHSLGGHVAIHSLKNNNPLGLFIFATPPLQKPFDPTSFLPNEITSILFQEDSTNEQIENLGDCFNFNENEKKQLEIDYKKTDPFFRTTILNSVGTSDYDSEIELLNMYTMYTGKLHILVSSKDSMTNNKYIYDALKTKNINIEFSFLEAGHVPHIESSKEFNSKLADFCQFAFSTTQSFNKSKIVLSLNN